MSLFGIGEMIGSGVTSAANLYQADKQMDFQKEMSSTAHQREVADLRAAGLNPALSGTGGAGASTGAGAQGQISNPLAGASQIRKTSAEATSAKVASKVAKKQGKLFTGPLGDANVALKTAKDMGLSDKSALIFAGVNEAEDVVQSHGEKALSTAKQVAHDVGTKVDKVTGHRAMGKALQGAQSKYYRWKADRAIKKRQQRNR